MAIDCKCTPVGEGFSYDNNACPAHGPSAPRYFIDHDTIHDRITGKHVELAEAAELLSVEPEAVQRIAWSVVTNLGAMLKNAEHERDTALARVEEIERELATVRRGYDIANVLLAIVALMDPDEGTNRVKAFRFSAPSLAPLFTDGDGDALYLDEAVKRFGSGAWKRDPNG